MKKLLILLGILLFLSGCSNVRQSEEVNIEDDSYNVLVWRF